MGTNEAEATLRAFIAGEASALAAGVQGSYWPENHHRIGPLVARAHRLLDEHSLGDFYFHLVRLGSLPAPKGQPEFEALVAAYRRAMPLHAGRRGHAVVRRILEEEVSPDVRARTLDILRRCAAAAEADCPLPSA